MFGPVPKGPSEGGEVLVNNNKNKFPALSGYMSNTVHKTEERSFQEERRDVMTMNKFFAGLIALVAGRCPLGWECLRNQGLYHR